MKKRRKPKGMVVAGGRVRRATPGATQIVNNGTDAPLRYKPSWKQRCVAQVEVSRKYGESILLLQKQLQEQKSQNLSNLEHMRARTELIKALGWAMKTCSSALWSDRKQVWGGPS